MEEDKKQMLQQGYPRRLNFNVPLLSIRRPAAVTSDKLLQENFNSNSINMVPFSWERIPGEPKDRGAIDDTAGNNDEQPYLPPPKLPPSRWQPTVTKEAVVCDVDQFSDYDDGCDDGDIDNDNDDDNDREEEHNGCFSDAIDIFSLAESIDDYEGNCKTSTVEDADAYQSPNNFIIQRFLPDAQALAAASVANKRLPFSTSPHSSPSFSRAVGRVKRTYPIVKGCGLGSFFNWRMKPKLCSIKSPVRDTSIRPVNPQWDISKLEQKR